MKVVSVQTHSHTQLVGLYSKCHSLSLLFLLSLFLSFSFSLSLSLASFLALLLVCPREKKLTMQAELALQFGKAEFNCLRCSTIRCQRFRRQSIQSLARADINGNNNATAAAITYRLVLLLPLDIHVCCWLMLPKQNNSDLN